ncbi:ATP-binding protein [Sphingomonas sp. LB-2]|uniref:sensor histidine kinase n=1 Tax=Sphingomonas caeni TaxID=2984949 RepID=UPI00222E7394|nr:histidine kinase dimerization/phosphoacceptor domain -containing protein [Sphingomonas caeni]MCW3847027.1 ATP-binding protein [Sphingomonas caeni]
MGEAREREGWHERLPLRKLPVWQSAAIIVGVVGLAFLARLALKPAIPVGSPFVTFFPAVLLVAFLLGVRRGAVAAALSTLLGVLFFMSDPMAPGYFATAVPSAVAYAVLVGVNLTLFHWMQSANDKLRAERARSAALANTRELLFRELQHRVSNNLQVAAGLLALQKKHVEGERARAALEEASRRIGVIGRISRQLYEHDGGTRSLHALIEPMCHDVLDAAGTPGVTLRVSGGESQALPADSAIPVALIVAEAVANAIEHGFAGREKGVISVDCMSGGNGGGFKIEIRDDGCGLPDGFAMENGAGLGLRIAATLAEQLGGQFELVARRAEGGGATARLMVPG